MVWLYRFPRLRLQLRTRLIDFRLRLRLFLLVIVLLTIKIMIFSLHQNLKTILLKHLQSRNVHYQKNVKIRFK